MGNLLTSTDEDNNSTCLSDSNSLPQTSILVEAEALRCEARQLRSEAKIASEQSQSAYHFGDRSQAKVLSIKKTNLYRKMDEKNHQAAELVFKHYNQDRPKNVIDLHGLYVAEALKYLQQKLNECRLENIFRLTVITGMGNNSPNKIAKIKPEVEKFARQNRLNITCYPGHVVIDLPTDNRCATTSYQDTNECIIL